MSLPEEDLAFVDEYAANTGTPSRSAVLRKAIRLLRSVELGSAYELAWDEWRNAEDSEVWEHAVGEGCRLSQERAPGAG